VVAADFNGDGKLDLATANQNGNNVSVLLGNGSGGFGTAIDTSVGLSPENLAVGDFNGDGKPDLAVLNTADGTVSILLGNGDGTFSASATPTVGTSPVGIAVGDFNGDGKLDLVVTDDGDNNVEVFLGKGNGTFGSGVTYTVGTGSKAPDAVAVGDFNGDGIPDLAVANFGDGTFSILLGNGSGGFGAPAVVSIGNPAASAPAAIVVGDFNGDGKLDVALADYGEDLVWTALGNGNGGFGTPSSRSVGDVSPVLPAALATGDLNGDGKLDLVVPNFNDGNFSILSGQP
jgi:hypothetical protein